MTKFKITTMHKQLMFVILTGIIYLLGFSIFAFSNNLFQYDISTHHLGAHIFPHLSMIASIITISILLLCLLDKFQQSHYQLILISTLILVLMLVPLSFQTFPLISSFSNAVYNLTEPWRQLYVPPAIRATLEGLLSGLTGALNIRSTRVESDWNVELIRYRYAAVILGICLLFFWWLAQTLKNTELKQQITQRPQTIRHLLTHYPYIFIICYLDGLDQGLFNYAYFLGNEILKPHEVQTYQYVIYFSGIICPIFIGKMADRSGIFLILVWASLALTACKLFSAGLAWLAVTNPFYYFFVVFCEAGFTSCLWMLSASLIGERLRTKGIFRSFALSNVAFASGAFSCSTIYNNFSGSFAQTKFITAILNLCLISLFLYFYKKHEVKN